jgi:hypothetical protein
MLITEIKIKQVMEAPEWLTADFGEKEHRRRYPVAFLVLSEEGKVYGALCGSDGNFVILDNEEGFKGYGSRKVQREVYKGFDY